MTHVFNLGDFMNKRSLTIYIALIIVFTIMLFTTLYVLDGYFNHSETETFVFDQFEINGIPDSFGYRTLSYNNDKYYQIESTFSKEDIKHITGNLELIVPRLSANWYKVKLNNQLIGIVGNPKNNASSIWNTVHTFTIDKSQLSNINTLRIDAYSEYKFGKSDLPIIIASSSKSSKILSLSRIVYEYTNYFFIGSLLSLSIFLILLYTMTKDYDKKRLLIPVAVLLAAIYFFDLTPMYYLGISLLNFRKLVFLCLYLSVALTSFAFSYLFDKRFLKQLGVLLIGLMVFALVFSQDLITFKKYYNRLNLLLILLIFSWLIVALWDRKKNPNLSNLVFVSSIVLVGPSMFEALNMYLNVDTIIRAGAYGIFGFALGMLLLSVSEYLEYQRSIYSEHSSLREETNRLNKMLIFDETTELYNQRYFYNKYEDLIADGINGFSVLYFDFDKFSLVNELYSHEDGDQLLKLFSNHIKSYDSMDVFKYSTSEFLLISDSTSHNLIKDLGDDIKNSFTNRPDVQGISTLLPITLSVGIASFPKDTFDLKTLLNCAQKATRYSKSIGGNIVTVYDTALNTLMVNDSEQLQRGLLSDFVYALATTIDQRDDYQGKHSEEVCKISMIIADRLNLDEDTKHSLMLGGLLHDLGKLGIAESLMKKSEALSLEEMKTIKNHPIYGYNIAKQFIYDQDILSCVKHHHERYDGAGYPDGLQGENIPLVARIISVADAYHAMVSNRPYRDALSIEMIISELHKNKGSQFDPKIADELIDYLL